MVALLAVVGLGAAWGLVDGITSDDDDGLPEAQLLSAPATSEYKPGLAVDVYRPEGRGPFPAVLLVHGGGLVAGARSDLGPAAQRLAANGIIGASIDYTLDGTEPPARADVAHAQSHVVQADGSRRCRSGAHEIMF